MQEKQHARIIVTAISLIVAGGVNAAGFALIEQNASGLGNAYAGQAASAQDASTIFFNPAGMTKLPDRQLVGALHAIKPSAKYSDGNIATPDGGDAGGLALVPNFYYAMALTPQTRIGVGINSPFGLKTEYDSNWIGRVAAIKSDLKTININPSIATKLSKDVSVGVGLNIDYIKADLTNYVPIALHLGGAPGNASIEGDDWGIGINAGLLYEFNSATRLGLAYRSRIKHTLEGDAKFAGSPLANTSVTAKATLPDIASISLVHDLNSKMTLLADATYTAWGVFKELRIDFANALPDNVTPENWEDSWRFSIGATYKLSNSINLRGGLAFDESPVPDAFRTPRIPDQDRTWIAFGLSYQTSPHGTIDAGYAHLFVKDASQSGSAAIPAGNYESQVDILSVQYTHTF